MPVYIIKNKTNQIKQRKTVQLKSTIKSMISGFIQKYKLYSQRSTDKCNADRMKYK